MASSSSSNHIAGHAVRITVLWAVITALLELLVAKVPVPSPVASTQALGEHITLYMLLFLGVPFFAFIWAMLIHLVLHFRRVDGDDSDGPPITDSTPLLLIWAGISFVTVVFLAGWGAFSLHEVTEPSGHGPPFHIQVIGQQWFWSYRYPTYGGMESNVLYLPVHQSIEFDITSLDVVHSFWIYNLDIKEDAVPGVVNHAYLNARQTLTSNSLGQNWVVCNELCGLYHGYMRSRMEVVTPAAFKAWATNLEARERADGLLKDLPPYRGVYFPPPVVPAAPQDESS